MKYDAYLEIPDKTLDLAHSWHRMRGKKSLDELLAALEVATILDRRYRNEEPIAVMGLTSSSGIAIFEIEHGPNDYAVVAGFGGESDGDGYDSFHLAKIEYGTCSEYFCYFQETYYIGDFIRTDIGR